MRLRTVLPLLLTACDGWPRYAAEDEDTSVPAVDPETLVDVTWARQSEDGDWRLPGGGLPMSVREGWIIEGTLEGIGWWDDGDDPLVVSTTCDAEAEVGAGGPGGWIGDYDAVVVESSEGTLCARARVEADDVGWDLLLVPIDDCGLPAAAVLDGDQALGVDLGGPSDGWSAPITAGRWAVVLAGYFPNDVTRQVTFFLDLALVPTPPDGAAAVCPAAAEGGAR